MSSDVSTPSVASGAKSGKVSPTAAPSGPGTNVNKVRIVHFQRKPVSDMFSIERLFSSLRGAMHELGQEVVPAVAPYPSKGLLRRIANIVWAARNQGNVNHITGDVHFLALGLRGERTVLTIHDCHSLERLNGIRRWLLKMLWFDLPIRRAAIVTAISEETKRQLLRYVRVPDDKIEVIPDAVSPVFRPSPKTFNAKYPRILHIGTKPNKNLPRLLEALKGMPCRLRVIGVLDDQQRRELTASGVNYDSQSNLSELDLYRAYCDADVVCFASTYEGFGMPIIEAQVVERPVVTSNCSSMPEVAGDGACLVDPFDTRSIRDGLQRVIQDAEYRERIVAAGRTNRERFSLVQVARRYMSLYERLRPR
jgi:glycosyltransferase involved in cell wall biosynthesis